MKKIWLITMALLLVFQLYPVQKADANSIFIRIVGGTVGERIVVSMAEKAGINYLSKTARKKAVQSWNARILKEIEKAELAGDTLKADELKNLQTMINSKNVNDVIPIATKPGYGKIAIDTLNFLTGADLLLDIYQEIKSGLDNQKYLDYMTSAQEAISSGKGITNYKGLRFYVEPYYGRNYLYFGSCTKAGVYNTQIPLIEVNKPYYGYIYQYSDSGGTARLSLSSTGWGYGNDGAYDTRDSKLATYRENIGDIAVNWDTVKSSCGIDAVKEYATVRDIPKTADIPNPISSPTMENRDSLPEMTELIIPVDDNYPEETPEPWNTPDLTTPDPNPDETPEPEDKPVGSSWWDWLLKPLFKTMDLIKSAIDGLVSLVTGLAKAIADAIGAIFVPSDGFFDGYFTDIKGSWDSKIPITGQLSDFMTTVKSSTGDASRPVIEIDLPPRYGGVKISVIDFSYFDQYRDWILNFIRFTAWFVFLKKLFARLPRIIGG